MKNILDELLVIIPARGGSKRIPYKNIVQVCGKPMIVWTLIELLKIINKEKIIVTSDDLKIINIVKNFGVDVPFKRPKHISDDYTSSSEAIKHALKWYEKNIRKISYVLIVYPTAIFIDSEDIKNACKLINENKNYSVVFTATEFIHPIERAFRFDKNHKLKMLFPEHYETRTQDLKKSYHDAGQFYLCRKDILINSEPLFNKSSKFIILPKIRSIDIDNPEDIQIAEALMKNFKLKI